MGKRAIQQQQMLLQKKSEIVQNSVIQIQKTHGEIYQSFQQNLNEFAGKYKDEIKKNPEFRDRFYDICLQMDVNPMVSKKNMFSELGFGDYFNELASKILDLCAKKQHLTGGINKVEDIQKDFKKIYKEQISKKDIQIALKTINCLGGVQLKDNYIYTVPLEMSPDFTTMIDFAEQYGKVNYQIAFREKQWSKERFQKQIQILQREGLVWIDKKTGGEPDYYFPKVMKQFNKTLSDKQLNSTTAPKFYKPPQPEVDQQPKDQYLQALKQENQILKDEIQGFKKHLNNVGKIFKSLEAENDGLKKQLLVKDQDLQRVVESIAINQSQNEKELKLQIQLFEEEQKIVSQHFESYKSRYESMKSQLDEKTKQIQKAKLYNDQVDLNLQNALQREKDFSNEVQLRQIKIEELEQQATDLQNKIRPLEEELRQSIYQKEQIEIEMKQVKENFKKTSGETNMRLTKLNAEFYQTKTDLQHLQHLCKEQEHFIAELKAKLVEQNKDEYMKQIYSLNSDITNLKRQLETESKRLANSIEREKQLSIQFDEAKLQIQHLTDKKLDLENELENLKNQQEIENSNIMGRHQKLIESIKQSNNQILKQQDEEILQLESQILQLRQENQDSIREIQDKTREIQGLKIKLGELDHSKKQVIELKYQIQMKETDNKQSQQQISEVAGIMKKQNLELEERIIMMQEQLGSEKERNQSLYSQNEQLKWYQEQYEELAIKIQENKIERDNLKAEIQSYISKVSQLENKNDEVLNKYQVAETEINKIVKRHIEESQALKKEIEIYKEQVEIVGSQQQIRSQKGMYTTTTKQEETNKKPVSNRTFGSPNVDFITRSPNNDFVARSPNQEFSRSPEESQYFVDARSPRLIPEGQQTIPQKSTMAIQTDSKVKTHKSQQNLSSIRLFNHPYRK